jgi:multiple sugar transport system substrate-binding protein
MKPPTESEVTSPVVPSVSATESPISNPSLSGLTRRELLIGGGKVAVVAAVSSLFSPFNINVKAATPKSLSFWQFYSPGGGVATQDKWFQDMVKSWNSSHDIKVELLYVPNQDYMNGSKLQTAFASGQGPTFS